MQRLQISFDKDELGQLKQQNATLEYKNQMLFEENQKLKEDNIQLYSRIKKINMDIFNIALTKSSEPLIKNFYQDSNIDIAHLKSIGALFMSSKMQKEGNGNQTPLRKYQSQIEQLLSTTLKDQNKSESFLQCTAENLRKEKRKLNDINIQLQKNASEIIRKNLEVQTQNMQLQFRMQQFNNAIIQMIQKHDQAIDLIDLQKKKLVFVEKIIQPDLLTDKEIVSFENQIKKMLKSLDHEKQMRNKVNAKYRKKSPEKQQELSQVKNILIQHFNQSDRFPDTVDECLRQFGRSEYQELNNQFVIDLSQELQSKLIRDKILQEEKDLKTLYYSKTEKFFDEHTHLKLPMYQQILENDVFADYLNNHQSQQYEIQIIQKLSGQEMKKSTSSVSYSEQVNRGFSQIKLQSKTSGFSQSPKRTNSKGKEVSPETAAIKSPTKSHLKALSKNYINRVKSGVTSFSSIHNK